LRQIRDPRFHLLISPQSESLRVISLTNSKTTAHELYAQKPDVVIVTYEFIENCYRRIKKLLNGKYDRRSTSALHSDLWELEGYPIKRVFIDEAHRLGKTTSARYLAVQAIPAMARALFSGTFPYNKWLSWAGPIGLARNQPFTNLRLFKHTFASYDSESREEPNPSISRMMLLQRFLMRFTIARPASSLELPEAHHFKCTVLLTTEESDETERHWALYTRAQEMAKDKDEKNKKKKGGRKGRSEALEKGESLTVLAHAIRAQLATMHTIMLDSRFQSRKAAGDGEEDELAILNIGEELAEDDDEADYDYEDGSGDDSDSDSDYDEDIEYADALYQTIATDRSEDDMAPRKAWLQHLEDNSDFIFDSSRINKVIEVYEEVRKQYPDLKIVIASQFLKFLDMVKVALEVCCGVVSLEYNGVLLDAKRRVNLDTFRNSDNASIPLILSGKAGGEGINIPEASVLVQCEPWWNRNAENQLSSRLHRQGQKNEVIIIRLQANPSSIDTHIINTQMKKKTFNSVLMRPLIRTHDEPPQVPANLYYPPTKVFS
jgi:SNF2 family DNA or RNA helicase